MRIGFASRDWSFSNVGEGVDLTHELPTPTTSPQFAEGVVRPHIGGAGYYRCVLPAKALQAAGHLVYVGVLVERNDGELGVHTFDGMAHFDLDVLILQRWMHVNLIEASRKAVKAGQIVLNDVDDYFPGLDPANRAFHTSHPKTDATENRNHYAKVLAAGSGVICSTPFLMDRVGKKARSSFLMRNRIDVDRYTTEASQPQEERPKLGWVGARPWRSAGDVEALSGLVGPFLKEHDLSFIHAGHIPNAVTWEGDDIPPLGETLGVPEERMIYRGMASMSDYPHLLEGFGIGVVPLADRPFNHAKSAIKGMEYAAAGVPFVASDTPEYRWLASQGIGRVAKRPKEWLRHWRELLDQETRESEARAQRALIRIKFNAKGYADDYEEIIAKVTADR